MQSWGLERPRAGGPGGGMMTDRIKAWEILGRLPSSVKTTGLPLELPIEAAQRIGRERVRGIDSFELWSRT